MLTTEGPNAFVTKISYVFSYNMFDVATHNGSLFSRKKAKSFMSFNLLPSPFGVPLIVQTKIYPFLIVNALEVNHTTILVWVNTKEISGEHTHNYIKKASGKGDSYWIKLGFDRGRKWLPGGMLIGKSKMCEQRFGMMIIQNQSK